MKKKIIGLLLLFSSCFLVVPSFTTMGSALSNVSNDTAREIDLDGWLWTGKQRSLVKPVEAFIIGGAIRVNFNATLGIILISIQDEAGNTVFQQSANTYAGQQLFIDITSFEEGEYTIGFIDSQDQYLYGSFVIE